MKIVLNRTYGGFGLSIHALALYAMRTGHRFLYDVPRDDPDLIAVVEHLGSEANNDYSCLEVIEMPDGTEYVIVAHDGLESALEKGHYWPS